MRAHAVCLLITAAACSSDPTTPDAGPARADAAPVVSPDAAPDPADAAPVVSPDAAPDPADAAPDPGDAGLAPADAEPSDGGPVGPARAVVGQRCSYERRRGTLFVSQEGINPRYVQLQLSDRPYPWLGPAELSDAACAFHRASRAPCNCQVPEVCSFQGMCVPAPVAAAEATVVATGANGTQTLRGDGAGSLGGQLTVRDAMVAFTITAGSLVVEVPAMSMPDELLDLDGTLTGGYERPTALDVTWRSPADAADVYSLTRINHHVGEATFTECVTPATAQRLHIDGAMLMPLAVVTGLEFQALEHTRFAAAEVPDGCFEVRFTRAQYVNLRE